MAGKFTGLTDAEWAVIEPLLPEQAEKSGKGRPHAFFRDILNTILWVLITGARWIDAPRGNGFGARSTSHRWLGIWTTNGTWAEIKALLMGQAHELCLIDWSRSSVDGSFAVGKGGGEDVQYGFKSKGITLHALVDGNGLPLSIISTGLRNSGDSLLNSNKKGCILKIYIASLVAMSMKSHRNECVKFFIMLPQRPYRT